MPTSITTSVAGVTSGHARHAQIRNARAHVRPTRPARISRARQARAERARPLRGRRAPAPALGLALGCCIGLLACGGSAGERARDQAAADSGAAVGVPADPPPADQGSVAPAAPRGDEAAAPPADEAGAPPADEAEDTSGARSRWIDPPVSAEHVVTGAATLTAVRTARHDGYDRVVFDFGDRPLPSYRIAYLTGPATQCGSGETVPLDAAATLEIAFQPAHAHTEQGQATVQARDRTLGLPALRRLVLTCDFEAHVDWAAAIEGVRPIRVLELAAPSRLVVDIRHPPG
jgi:hypothetical protein